MKKTILLVLVLMMVASLAVAAFAPIRLVRVKIKNNTRYHLDVRLEPTCSNCGFHYLPTVAWDETVWTVVRQEYAFNWYISGDGTSPVCLKPAVGLSYDQRFEQLVLNPLASTVIVVNECANPSGYLGIWYPQLDDKDDAWWDLWHYTIKCIT